MSDTVELSYDFVQRYVRFAKPEYLQIYIYILCSYKKDNVVLSTDEIMKKLHIDQKVVEAALDYWITCGVLISGSLGYDFPEDELNSGSLAEVNKEKKKVKNRSKSIAHTKYRPSYTSQEIDASILANKELDYLFKQSEIILDKVLSSSDIEMLYSFTDWLGLPVEVIIMMLTYAAGHGKTTKRYLETVAVDWADKGINTYEKAEEYVKELEEMSSNEHKVRAVLGIYDRNLTSTEKKYIKLWTVEMEFSPDMINVAYDRTVESTGKLSWAYMSKILKNWFDNGLKTVEHLNQSEEIYKLTNNKNEKSNVSKSKFNNYTDTNEIDYSKMSEKILQDILDYGD